MSLDSKKAAHDCLWPSSTEIYVRSHVSIQGKSGLVLLNVSSYGPAARCKRFVDLADAVLSLNGKAMRMTPSGTTSKAASTPRKAELA
jgi:hypothetical protein